MINGSWLLFLSSVALRHELGAIAWLVAAFSIYGGVIFVGFVMFPHEIPAIVHFLCVGDMEAEYYALLWPSTIDLWPDTVDRTWIWPAVAAILELLGFTVFF